MKSISLNGQWKLKGREQEGGKDFISLNAAVPGEVQLDFKKYKKWLEKLNQI